jgi:hypothetical protein
MIEGVTREPYDNHCWITISGVSWRIAAMRPHVVCLWRGFEPEIFTASFDPRDDWDWSTIRSGYVLQ